MKASMTKLLSLAVALLATFQLSAKDYDVQDFGAVADGIALNTNTIQHAIDFVHENGGGRLVFHAGTYLTGSIYIKSNVTLHLERGATLLGSTNPLDYNFEKRCAWHSLIFAIDQENIGITGQGVIDGQGFTTANNRLNLIHRGFNPGNDVIPYDRPREWNRPQNIYFRECKNITIKDITLRDPASWNQTYDQCVNLYVDNIYVDSKSYWNNDGIDIVDCKDVVIKNSFFDAADDVLCLKSHSAEHMCENVLIDNCVGRSSANGLKFGTVSRGGFKNITVTNMTIYDTYRSAITFAAVDGAHIENILVDGVRSINTGNVIYLRIGNRWSKGKEPVMKDVTIKNVYAEVPFHKADAGYSYEGPIEDLPRNISPASIVGLPEYKIENVTLENVEIVYPGAGNPYYAKVGLTPEELDGIPEQADRYPEFSQFKELPAWGMYIRHANGIHFKNVTFKALASDYRPAIVLDDVNGGTFEGMKYIEPNSEGKNQLFDYKSQNIEIK